MSKENKSSSHILNASSNLLGICFIVLTSLKLLDKSDKTVIDEITIVAIIAFMLSCILSFLAIKSSSPPKVTRLESIADIVFLIGLCILFITTILFALDVIP